VIFRNGGSADRSPEWVSKTAKHHGPAGAPGKPIHEALVRHEHVVSVFFDLVKACDITWRDSMLRNFSKAGLTGQYPVFIANFLRNRQFRGRVGTCLSSSFHQVVGVPSGSILLVTLFILRINSIIKSSLSM
jgi:hypothetical protein